MTVVPRRFSTWPVALAFAATVARVDPRRHPRVRQVVLATGAVWEVTW